MQLRRRSMMMARLMIQYEVSEIVHIVTTFVAYFRNLEDNNQSLIYNKKLLRRY